MKISKNKFGILVIFVLVIATINLISAFNWQCFVDRENINFCGNIPDRVCDKSVCKYCMNGYDNVNKCFHYGGWNACNSAPPECIFSGGSGGSGVIDTQPPVINLTSPINNTIYIKRVILFSISTNEMSDIYYTDMINGRGRWIKICTNCKTNSGNRNFNEGINKIKIRAKDKKGNEAFKEVTFFIDTKVPKIHKIIPKQDFATGNFSVQYSEDNLKKINLTYGNTLKGWKSLILTGCLSGKKVWCNANNINLSNYSGQEIQYYFNVGDNAGNKVISRIAMLKVDTVAPKINSFTNSSAGNKIIFKFNIQETNFDKIEYTDNFNGKFVKKILCSSLKDGICEKGVTFSSGNHNLIFKVTDEAGNFATKVFNFSI